MNIRTFAEYKQRYFPNDKEPLPEDPVEAGRQIVKNAIAAHIHLLDIKKEKEP